MNPLRKDGWGGPSSNEKYEGILPQSMLFQVYKALVENHLRYADVS